MTWLEGNLRNTLSPGLRLATRLQQPGILRTPGAHNGLAGLAAKRAGFEALYISGAGLSASMGLPDLGVMTLEEVCFFVRMIFRATDLPLIVDADTGYGEALNVMRTVQELEMAGAAAMQIEDQKLPKKCGHLNDKQLVSADDMVLKVAAAARSRTHLQIIARTDALASEGMQGAVSRANAYIEAGADVVFADGLATEAEFREFVSAVKAPSLANMTEFGRTPYYTGAQFEAMGYKIVIWPVSQLRVASRAMENLYAAIAETDGTKPRENEMQTRAEQYELIRYFDYEALDSSIVKTVVPQLAE
ncbi:MAG: methylisocitrate lyase [Rhodospirillales bacterium]|nr:methylisocitrate lyase [Rhodospirillales bacterium]